MPLNPTDVGRGLFIDSPLGEDLLCHSFSGNETLGRLFDYRLGLYSLDRNLLFEHIVGQRVTVTLELPDGERYFDGFVTEFKYMGMDGQYASYQALMKPWLWFLTRTADCRIFQNQTVPDIIQSVFRDNDMSDFSNLLCGSYREWVYCVQYRETDFNFVSRLMEQEGIFYYFQHIHGKHTLCLADDVSSCETYPGYETVPYFPPDPNAALRERDHIQQVYATQTIMPSSCVIKDFDFEKPRVDLYAQHMWIWPHAYPIPDPEIFDYPGEFSELDDGETSVNKRIEELHAQVERVEASGTARGMCAGCLFTLELYPRPDLNKEFLLISVTHEIVSAAFETSAGAGAGDFYSCHLELMDSAQPFRSMRVTPKPIVQGLQTAIVVGREEDEIYCDEYARVKVQFHWDRYGQNDQNSSCWVRVSQLWAGKNWGGIHIPRIGQEVLVSFLEGDPDRPLITGRVYNADHMPPYELDANKTQSGIKSRSTKNGTPNNFNEIRMEDKKGSEELYIQAEKNENILVKNDKTETVGHDETISIGNDRTETVGHDMKTTVTRHHTLILEEGGNDTLTVRRGTRTVTVNGDTTCNVQSGKRQVDVGAGDYICNSSANIVQTAPTITLQDAVINLFGTDITIQGTTITLSTAGGTICLDGSGVTISGTKIDSLTGGVHTITGGPVNIN